MINIPSSQIFKNLFIFILLSFSTSPVFASPFEIGKKWPIYWNQFKSQPNEKDKVFITVRFTKSIDEACKIFQKASESNESKSAQYNKAANEIDLKSQLNFYTKEEYEKRINKKLDEIGLVKTSIRKLSTAVEVLRQAGYKDWKLFSRYSTFGVGDLRREQVENELDLPESKKKYLFGTREAREICETFGFDIPFSFP